MKYLATLLLAICCLPLAAQDVSSLRPIRPGTRNTGTTTNSSNTDVTMRPGTTVPDIPDITVEPVQNPVSSSLPMEGVGEKVRIEDGFEGSVDDYLFITGQEEWFSHAMNLAYTLEQEGNEDSAANQMKGAMATVDYEDTYAVRRLFNIQAILGFVYAQQQKTEQSDAQLRNAFVVEQRWLDQEPEVTSETLDLRMKIGHDLYGLEFYSMAGERFKKVLALANSAEGLNDADRGEAIAHAQHMLARLNTIWGKTETAMDLFEKSLAGGALNIKNSNTKQLFHPADDPAFLPLQTGPRWGELQTRYEF